MTSFKTKYYAVLVGDGAGRGTFIVERIATGETTLRFTGTAAWETYRKLRAIFRKRRADMDTYCCAFLTFEKD